MAAAQGARHAQVHRLQPRSYGKTLGNGYITKKPKKKRTSAQVIAESEPDDHGSVRLRINPQNAGPAPRIHYAEDGPVTESSAQLKDHTSTAAFRVNFLVVDPSGQFETGDPVTWSNKLVLRNKLSEKDGERNVELLVAPKAPSVTRLTAASRATARPTRSRLPSVTAKCFFARLPRRRARDQGGVRFPVKGKRRRRSTT